VVQNVRPGGVPSRLRTIGRRGALTGGEPAATASACSAARRTLAGCSPISYEEPKVIGVDRVGAPIMLQLNDVHRTGHAVSRRDDRGRVTVTVRLDD
jgi:hypothetical protein